MWPLNGSVKRMRSSDGDAQRFRKTNRGVVQMIRIFAKLAVVTPLLTSPAFAHAFLDRSDPPVGSEVASPPHQISLHFTEGVEPLFCSVEIHDAQGVVVPVTKPHTAPGDDRTLLVAVPELHTGRYTVTWHATSVDTHKTEGHFEFSVAH